MNNNNNNSSSSSSSSHSHHRGADPGSYSPLRSAHHAAPMPFFVNNPYGGSRHQDSSNTNNRTGALGSGRLPSGAKIPGLFDRMTTEGHASGHTRLNSDGVNAMLKMPLSTTNNEGPTANRDGGDSRGKRHRGPQQQQQQQQQYQQQQYMHHESQQDAESQSPRKRLDPRSTARSTATTSHRLGMPYNVFQRKAPKADHISATMASQAKAHSPEKTTCPTTSNSNFTSAFIRISQPGSSTNSNSGPPPPVVVNRSLPPKHHHHHSRSHHSNTIRQTYDLQPDGKYVRRFDVQALRNPLPSTHATKMAAARRSRSSSGAASPLDSSIQTLLRTSSSDESDAGESFQGRRHARGQSGASTAGRNQRLMMDVLSPTGESAPASTSSVSERNGNGNDLYGSRNLGSVAARTSASATVMRPESLEGIRPPRPRHRPTSSSSGFLDKLHKSSMNFLVRAGVFTPPQPRNERSLVPSSSSSTGSPSKARLPLALPPSASQGGRHHHRGSTSTSSNLGHSMASQGMVMEYHLDDSNTLRLLPTTGAGHEATRRGRIDSGGSLASISSLSTSGNDPLQQHLSRLSLSSSHKNDDNKKGSAVPPEAVECARTALDVIIGRLMAAQGKNQETTTFEIRKFVEGGGVDALIRAIETLGNEPGLAFNLMYVLRVTMSDEEARHQAVGNAKGHILLEHIPAVMKAHMSSAPIFRDGLTIMTILLNDEKTRQTASTLLCTPITLEMVREARKNSPPGRREAKLCTEFLNRVAIAS